MSQATNILAARDGSDLVSIIIFLAVVVISVIAKVGEKLLRKYNERRAEEELRRREASGETRPMQARPSEVPGPARSARPFPPMPQRRQPGTRQPPRPYPSMAARREPEPVPVFPEPRPVQPPPKPVRRPAAAAEPAPQTVEQELARLKERLAEVEVLREKRMATAAPQEADTARIEARLLHVAPALQAAKAGEPTIRVDLSDPRHARLAVILREILSGPNALRDQPELWDA